MVAVGPRGRDSAALAACSSSRISATQGAPGCFHSQRVPIFLHVFGLVLPGLAPHKEVVSTVSLFDRSVRRQPRASVAWAVVCLKGVGSTDSLGPFARGGGPNRAFYHLWGDLC